MRALAGKVAVVTDYGITDVDGKVIPSLRAQRGSPIWRPITEAGALE